MKKKRLNANDVKDLFNLTDPQDYAFATAYLFKTAHHKSCQCHACDWCRKIISGKEKRSQAEWRKRK